MVICEPLELTTWGSRRMVRRGALDVVLAEAKRRDPDLVLENVTDRLGLHPSALARLRRQERVSLDRFLGVLRAVHIDPWEVGL